MYRYVFLQIDVDGRGWTGRNIENSSIHFSLSLSLTLSGFIYSRIYLSLRTNPWHIFFFFPLPPGISIVSALSIVVELCDVTTNEIADR